MQTIWYNFDNPHSDVAYFQLVVLALLLGLFFFSVEKGILTNL